MGDSLSSAGDEEQRFRPSAAPVEVERLRQYLVDALQHGATDIHLRAGDAVYARIGGKLTALDTPVLTAVSTFEMVTHILGTSVNAPNIDSVRDYSGPWSAPGVARFRVSILRQRSSFAIVMRVVPSIIPTFEELRIPKALGNAVLHNFGLVFVSGVPGSGRTSTLAAIVHHLNTHSPERRHIVVIESAIEFLHKNDRCSVTQREVGIDTDNFADGMRSALEQDADVIVVGELDDPELIQLAIRAAEAGRLVIGKFVAPDATATLRAFFSGLPADQQDTARLHASEMLRAVISQRLLPRADAGGRVLASELLLMTPLVREVIADAGRLAEIRPALAEGRAEYGTQTFDQALADLVIGGHVSFEVALTLATNSLDFELQLRGLRR
ncbi:MAG TPA: ATPase, T2SS/T4P/T4SS family [Gemmatimonadaceae bacterium]|nr:ATPase, T2SS/T4P/T4SS family [Gemmatimonadaceae bacterium]